MQWSAGSLRFGVIQTWDSVLVPAHAHWVSLGKFRYVFEPWFIYLWNGAGNCSWSWWRWSEITDTVIFWYVVRNSIWSSSWFLVWAPKKPWTFLSGGSPRGVLCFVNELNCGTHPRVRAGFWWSPLYDQTVGTSSPTPWPPGRGEGLEIKLNHQ